MIGRLALLASLAAALLPALALVACDHEPAVTTAPPAASARPADEVWISKEQLGHAQIEIAPIAVQELSDAIVTSGRVTFDDLRVGHVFSPLTGRVTRIDAQLGQRVAKGATLATILSPDLGQASADLSKAEAELVQAEHDFKRKSDLLAAHAASQADVEAAEDAYRKAKAERERAAQKARMLRNGGDDLVTQGYTLRAPIDGEVIARAVAPGAEVQGQYGGGTAAELFTIGELDRVWVIADVFEMDLPRVHVGSKVSASVVAYPGRVFEGTVDWVSGGLDAVTRTARVRCVLPNADRALHPEMYATVRLSVGQERALAVPREAVLRLGDELLVWAEQGTTPEGLVRFQKVPVSVDDTTGGSWLPLTKGPAQGTRIVSSGGIILLGMLGGS